MIVFVLYVIIVIAFITAGAKSIKRSTGKGAHNAMPPFSNPVRANEQLRSDMVHVNQKPRPDQIHAYSKQMTGNRKSSGNVILDRVLKENVQPEMQTKYEPDTEAFVMPDLTGFGMQTIEQSPYIQEVYRLMVSGYEAQMPKQRDFLAEGLALLDEHVVK